MFAVAATLTIRYLLEPVFGRYAPYLPFIFSVLVVARFLGAGPGLLSTALSSAAIQYWFIEPRGSFRMTNPHAEAGLLLFAGEGILISFLLSHTRNLLNRLAASKEKLQFIIDSASAGTWDWDLKADTLTWSDRCYAMYGLAPVTPVTYARFQQAVHPDDVDLVNRAIQTALDGKGEYHVLMRSVGGDDGTRWIEVRGRCYYDESGNAVRLSGVVLDVTPLKDAEKRIEDRNAQLEEITRTLDLAHAVVRKLDGTILYVTNGLCDFYGVSRSEILGKRTHEIFQTEFPKPYEEIMADLYRDRQWEGELKHYKRDRTPVWVASHWAMEQPADGEVRLIEVNNDITAQKAAEQALAQSLERLEKVLEVETVGVMFWDLNTGCMIDANEAFLNLMGYSRTHVEARELSWQNLTPPEYMDVSRAEIEKFLATGRVGPYEKEYFRADGTRKWLLFAGSSLGNNQCVEFCVDISDRKKAEQALRESENRFRSVFENAATGIAITDWDGRIEECNPSYAAMLGYTVEELRSLNFCQQSGRGNKSSLIHPQDRAANLEKICQLKAGELPAFEIEHRYVHKDGQPIPVHKFVSTLPDRTGKPAHLLALVTDVTVRKRAEEQIRRLNGELEDRVRERTAQLEAANKELEAFAYSVSHDLRAPLRGIDGWGLALFEDYGQQLDSRALQYLGRVRSETQRMGLLIDDLLMLSRINQKELKATPIDMSAVAQSVATRLMAENSARKIEFVIQPGLASIGDPVLIDVVLTNLFGNAVKFTGTRSEAHIEFGRIESNGECAFYVKDNGVGFDMAYADRLFGAFQRLHKATEFPGTGIGLATVQRVIRRHGGRVWAEAQRDCGATFYFMLGYPVSAGEQAFSNYA